MRGQLSLRTTVGSVSLPNPVLTASGTSGHGAELAPYVDLSTLGAVTVKSLAATAWDGNPAPRVHETPAGMLNSVGLQGPGVQAWLERDLPALTERGARVVASIWGRRVEDFGRAAAMLVGAPGVIALEVNVSCPNLDDRSRMFAHSPHATGDAVAAAGLSGLPLWVKLSPNVPDLTEIAAAALHAGAEALVLVNTLLGMSIDPARRAYRLGSGPGGGGLSGPAIRPVAVRAVHDCRAAFPDAAIVGVGGVSRGVDAVEMMLAGADAVEVGTATFRDPRAPAKVLRGLARWCRWHGVDDVRTLVGAVHRSVDRTTTSDTAGPTADVWVGTAAAPGAAPASVAAEGRPAPPGTLHGGTPPPPPPPPRPPGAPGPLAGSAPPPRPAPPRPAPPPPERSQP